ncbi:MAG: ATP-binding protein [Anaerolineales bacterium]
MHPRLRMPNGGLPVRVRLTLWYLLLSGSVLVAFGLFQYCRLQDSLMTSIDSNLQIAATQALANTDNENGHPAFQNTNAFANLSTHLGAEEFTVRIVAQDGTVLDSFGASSLALAPGLVRAGFDTSQGQLARWRIYSQPIPSPGGTDVTWLQAAQSLSRVDQTVAGLRTQLLLGLPVILLLLAAGGVVLADRALRPIDHITRTTQELSARDLSQRIDYVGPDDEVGRLASTIDGMLARLEQAFDHERRFTADAAHELRTPLTALKGQIQVALGQERTAEVYRQTLEIMQRQVDRLIGLSDGLLFLARADHDHVNAGTTTVDLSELVEILSEQTLPLAESRELQLTSSVERGLVVEGDQDLLIRLVFNLLDNAFKYTPAGGRVSLSLQRDRHEAMIKVMDTGLGIAAGNLPHVFERFYRVDDDRSSNSGGTGLGLAMAAEIAQLHHGSITVESETGKGTTFTVRLPLQPR